LLVKLSSLGDVVHSLPAAMDMMAAVPGVQIDWVVEPAFAPVLKLCPAVHRVIPCALRQWRKSFWTADTRRAWTLFKQALQTTAYDAVIDLQGLTKSALIAKLARLGPGGKRYAMAHRTEGSAYEAPTRWVADVLIDCAWHSHALDRGRHVCRPFKWVCKPSPMSMSCLNPWLWCMAVPALTKPGHWRIGRPWVKPCSNKAFSWRCRMPMRPNCKPHKPWPKPVLAR
jgi:heptosyltransferase-1